MEIGGRLWVIRKVYASLVICKEYEEPYEARVSRTVLRETKGEVPSVYSTYAMLLN